MFANASFACRADWENLKARLASIMIRIPHAAHICCLTLLQDQLLYHVITRRCTNCLSHLYTGSDRSVEHIARTVKARVLG